MCDLSRDLQDDIDADRQANAAIKGHHLEFRVGGCPTKREVRDVRKELLALFGLLATRAYHLELLVFVACERTDDNEARFAARDRIEDAGSGGRAARNR